MKINTAALSLLAASAAAVPLSSINATASPSTNATATATGPGWSIEPCVMPDGCRGKHKRPGPFDPPRKTVSHASSTTAEPTSRSAPSFGDWFPSIIITGTSDPPKITRTLIRDPMPTVPPMA